MRIPVAAAVAALILIMPAAPTGLHAQELRSHRHMAVGNVAFLTGLRPAVHGGYLLQTSLARSRTHTDEFGVPTIQPPRWYAHVLASGGWSFDADGHGRGGATALGQLGLVRRLDTERALGVARVGLAAQGSLAPEGYGLVTRWGLFHGNAAVSLGWMRFPERADDRFVISVDLLRCILQDLGLVGRCVIPPSPAT